VSLSVIVVLNVVMLNVAPLSVAAPLTFSERIFVGRDGTIKCRTTNIDKIMIKNLE
jgi:hypothetical protein